MEARRDAGGLGWRHGARIQVGTSRLSHREHHRQRPQNLFQGTVLLEFARNEIVVLDGDRAAVVADHTHPGRRRAPPARWTDTVQGNVPTPSLPRRRRTHTSTPIVDSLTICSGRRASRRVAGILHGRREQVRSTTTDPYRGRGTRDDHNCGSPGSSCVLGGRDHRRCAHDATHGAAHRRRRTIRSHNPHGADAARLGRDTRRRC